MSEKNKLAEKLLYAPKNGYDRLSAEDEKAMEAYCEDYKADFGNTIPSSSSCRPVKIS